MTGGSILSNPLIGWLAFATSILIFLIYQVWVYRTEARRARRALAESSTDCIRYSEGAPLMGPVTVAHAPPHRSHRAIAGTSGSESDRSTVEGISPGSVSSHGFPKFIEADNIYRYVPLARHHSDLLGQYHPYDHSCMTIQ
jgi:hypothetical protein